MKKIDYKKLAKYIIVPLILGFVVGFLSGSFKGYTNISTPKFIPPKIVFPIVWSILYVLMGISRYLIDDNEEEIKIYNIQLAVNLLWSFFFFTFKWYLFSFLWIILLIILVVIMIVKFIKVSKTSGLIQIPYLLWLIFAAALNYSIYLLN